MIKRLLTLFFSFANPRTKNLLDFLISNQINKCPSAVARAD